MWPDFSFLSLRLALSHPPQGRGRVGRRPFELVLFSNLREPLAPAPAELEGKFSNLRTLRLVDQPAAKPAQADGVLGARCRAAAGHEIDAREDAVEAGLFVLYEVDHIASSLFARARNLYEKSILSASQA